MADICTDVFEYGRFAEIKAAVMKACCHRQHSVDCCAENSLLFGNVVMEMFI